LEELRRGLLDEVQSVMPMSRNVDPSQGQINGAGAAGSLVLVALQERLATEPDAARRLVLIDEALRPPEPQLLDTCVLQNIDWVDRHRERGIPWCDTDEMHLREKYGPELADDLISLAILYTHFENESGYPWLVCNAAIGEAGLLRGTKGKRLMQLIEFLIGHQDQWTTDAYPGIAQGLLLSRTQRVSPLILQALAVASVNEIHAPDGPLSFLPDRGDRLVTAHALVANIAAILTTDRKTFWERRDQLLPLGVQVLRPGELLDLYEPYWEALRAEFERRRETSRRVVREKQ
jgi:hypothetical protein